MDLRAVNLNILGTKAQSKVEMYRLLTVDWNLFLPPQRGFNLFHKRYFRAKKEGKKLQLSYQFNRHYILKMLKLSQFLI